MIALSNLGCFSIKTDPMVGEVIEKSRWDSPPWKDGAFVQIDGLAYVHRFEDQDLLQNDPEVIKGCKKAPCRSTRLDRRIESAKITTIQMINRSLLNYLGTQAMSPHELKRLTPVLWQSCEKWSVSKVEIADLYYEKRRAQDVNQKTATIYTLWILTKVPKSTPEEILALVAARLQAINDPAALVVTKALKAINLTGIAH